MSQFEQLKESLIASFDDRQGFPADLSFATPSLRAFLDALDLSRSRLEISQPDESSLKLTIDDVASLPISGILDGNLEIDELDVTLRQGEADKFYADLGFRGGFVRSSARQALELRGEFTDGDRDSNTSDTLTLTLDTADLPQLPEMAEWVGLENLTEDLLGLGFELPTLNGASLSIDLTTRKLTAMSATGALALAGCAMDATIAFDPDATLTLNIAGGETWTLTEAIAAFGLNTNDLPDIALDTFTLIAQPSAKIYTTTASLASAWSVDVGGSALSIASVALAITSTNGDKAMSLAGVLEIGKATLVVTASRESNDAPLKLLCDLEDGDMIELGSAIEKLVGTAAAVPVDLPDFLLTEIIFSIVPSTGEYSFFAESDDLWSLDIGATGLDLDDVTLQIDRSVTATGTKATTGTIGGTLEIAAVECRCEYAFPGEFILGGTLPPFKLSPILQDLGGTSALKGLPVPLSVLAVECEGGAIAIAPKSKTLAISARSKLGTTELNLARGSSGWNFAVGFAPPESWKFSSIDKSLSVLDGLKFSETALVLASNTDAAGALTAIGLPESGTTIRGMNFFATLDMRGTGVDSLLGLEALTVYSAIGGKPSDLVIEAVIDGEFDLGDGVLFGDIKLRLQPAPSNFALSLLGTVSAELDGSALRFVGGMSVTPRSALFQAAMEGIWQDPFDTRNVAIANVALELGISMPPLLPSLGLAGTLQVGEFEGMVAVKFDAAVPSRSMLAIAFNRLYLMDVISTFCGTSIAQAIPAGLTKTVLDLGFEDVNIYIVPQPTTIGTLVFEQGFYLGGTLVFWGWRATASLSIDYVDGTELSAELDPIDIGDGIFKLTGALGEAKPSLYLKVAPDTVPALKVSGAVELLGLRSETYIEFSDSGFYFFSQGSIFGLFETSLEVSGADFSNGGSYYIKATMQNDLMEYLRENATKAIQKAADSATAELKKAQNDVKAAEREVAKLSKNIAKMREKIQKERDRDTARLKAARAEVSKAQKKVNSVQSEIAAMRKQVQRERDAATKDLKNARSSVTKAQNSVNSIQNDINGTKSRISHLKSDIDKKRKWYKKSKWHQKSYRWAEYSAYAAKKGTEIGALYTKIGGLETAKATANGALEAAKQVLRGIEAGMDTFPIDADPRLVGLFAAKETANASLVIAKETVKLIEQSIQTIPMELDPRLGGLYTAKETADLALDAAYYTLEGVKISVGAIAEVSTFIAEVGLGGLLDVKSAEFEGSLEATSGGSVSLALELSFMQKLPQSLALAFNFQSPLAAAETLAKKLLPA